MGELDKLIPSDRQINAASRHDLRIHSSFPPMDTATPSAYGSKSSIPFKDRLDPNEQSENIEDRRDEDVWNEAKKVRYTDVNTPVSRNRTDSSDFGNMMRSSARDVYYEQGYTN